MAQATLPQPALTEAPNGTHVLAYPDTPTARLTTVTPQMATDWLASAHPNRPVSRARVRMIARAIAAGLWQVNGQTLVLCPELRLLDGRHRCMAIVEAGVSVQTFVVVGIDPVCFATMDQGGKRSGADVLSIAGHPQAQTLASALRWLWRYENQEMLRASIPLLDYELPSYLAQYQGMGIVSSLSWGLMLKALVPPGVATALHLLMHRHDPRLAKAFFVGLAQGVELTASDPVYQVRERLLHERRELYHTAVVERAAALVHAWNCRRTNRPMTSTMLKWRADKSAQFPTVE
jgi:hypothetical protein